MEFGKGCSTLERGVSCPGRLRESVRDVPDANCTDASWNQTSDFNKDQMSRKTNLTRSTSLSERELKEARVRSQIIAAQLTVPTSCSSSRGVQLFNRRRQRVNAFTSESGGGSGGGGGGAGSRADDVTAPLSNNKPTWAERSREEKDLNLKNSSGIFLSAGMSNNSDIMEEPDRDFQRGDRGSVEGVIQERHFLPVKDTAEEEDKPLSELGDTVKAETPPGSNNADPVVIGRVEGGAEMNEAGAARSVPAAGKLPNGCHESQPESSGSKQIINRTARPFFSPPPTARSPEAFSPVTEIPPAPSYATPPLPKYPAAFSPPPPPAPSYPMPPLPAFTSQPPQQAYFSSPPPMSPTSPTPCFQQYEPSHHAYGPPTAPKPSAFVPQAMSETPNVQIKTGILEDVAAKRGSSSRKAMFTFKEKTIVAPNPELLSMVKGVDAKKKQSQSIPEPTTEEELMALGAEASNFLAKEEVKAEEAKAPEWASSLKTSRTRPRAEHRPENTLANVSGKGAELFAKRQSRMEKYVVENPKTMHRRSPSPTMSLPPSWVYPSNMPGRVKAIAKNSDVSAQLSQNLIAQQAAKQKPKPRVPIPQQAPPPAPPPAPPVENGCSKIEMDLSRHRPYQLDSSLFILKPVHQDPLSALPRGAPQSQSSLSRSQSLPRQTNPLSQYRSQCMSPPMAMGPTAQQRIESPAFAPERVVASPRSGAQAPRPTFSAKKAGLEGQKPKESCVSDSPPEPRPPSLVRRFSSPADPSTVTWSPVRPPVISPASTPRGSRCQSPQSIYSEKYRPAQTPSGPSPWGSRCQSPSLPNTQASVTFRPAQTPTSPIPAPWGSRCQSPMTGQNIQSSSSSSAFTSRPSQTSTSTSPVSPPWAIRCKFPVGDHNTPTALSVSKPAQTSPVSPPWGSRSQSPKVNHTLAPSRPSSNAASSPVSPWGSRCQSPALSQTSLSLSRPLYRSAASSPVPTPKDSRCMSPVVSNMDSKANHRLLAKNIINAAKRKNSVSPGALSGHSLPVSPVGNSHHGFDSHKPPISPFHSRTLGAQSPTFTSPPPTPTVCSPVRLYNTRSLTDSDASVESEDSGLRSPGLHYNTLPRGWGGSLRVKRTTVSTDL